MVGKLFLAALLSTLLQNGARAETVSGTAFFVNDFQFDKSFNSLHDCRKADVPFFGKADRNFKRPHKARHGQQAPWAGGCTTRKRPSGRTRV
jgi:hypothetical protein